MEHPMTKEYAVLSWLTGVFSMRADMYIGEPYFQTKARVHVWDLTPDLLAAWKQEALRKGVPVELVEPLPDETALAESPEFIRFMTAAQEASDKKKRAAQSEPPAQ